MADRSESSALWRGAALLLVAGLCAGCTTLRLLNPDYLLPAKRESMVRQAAEKFGQNLRWGRYEVAAGLVAAERREEFLNTFLNAEPPYQFTSFELIGVELSSERDRVEVLAVFELYRPPSLRMRAVTERQTWRYQTSGRPLWVLEPDLSVFISSGRARADLGEVRAARR